MTPSSRYSQLLQSLLSWLGMPPWMVAFAVVLLSFMARGAEAQSIFDIFRGGNRDAAPG